MCDRCVEWGGKRWHKYASGYYEYRGTRSLGRKDRDRLHRAVYSEHFGAIPKGFDVHHKDENRANNAIDNLELIPHGEHRRQHQKGRPNPHGRDVIKLAQAVYNNAPRVDLVCEWCREPFSGHMYNQARFCSHKCNQHSLNARVSLKRKEARLLRASLQSIS